MHGNLLSIQIRFLAEKRFLNLNLSPIKVLSMQSHHFLARFAPFLGSLLFSSFVGALLPSILMSIGFSPVLTRILIDSVLMKLSLRNGSVFDAL